MFEDVAEQIVCDVGLADAIMEGLTVIVTDIGLPLHPIEVGIIE